MTDEEMVEKNIALAFRFIQAAIDDPSLLAQYPSGAHLRFLPADDADMTAVNRQCGERERARGEPVAFVPLPALTTAT